MSIYTKTNDGWSEIGASVASAVGGGKVLQVVRATATGVRSCTSTDFVPIELLSVTISPTKADSKVLLLMSLYLNAPTNGYIMVRIADSDDNPVSGAESLGIGSGTAETVVGNVTHIGYSAPATTNAVTYKGMVKVSTGIGSVDLANNTGQLYAIEVGA